MHGGYEKYVHNFFRKTVKGGPRCRWEGGVDGGKCDKTDNDVKLSRLRATMVAVEKQ
jgi:hypothetical protein